MATSSARTLGSLFCVMRDAEHHVPTREIVELRILPYMAACRDILGRDLAVTQDAVLGLALGFYAWRALARDGGLTQDAAAKTMAQAVLAA